MPLPNTFGAASARGFGAFSFQTPSDPNFSSVSLLLPGNGTNGAQNNTFLDSSTNNFTITRNGNTTQGTFSPFPPSAGSAWSAAINGGSGYFDGSGDYLTTSPNAAFRPSGNFTIEAWVYLSTVSGVQNFFTTQDSGGFYQFSLGTNGTNARFTMGPYSGAYAVAINAGTLTTGAWFHIAVARSGTGSNNIRMWINGTSVAQATSNATPGTETSVEIGREAFGGSNPFTGYMGGLRIVTGSAVYDPTQSTITVPTSPLTAITNTSLLLNFTNGAIYDAAAKNDLETVGNAQISTAQSKWGGSSMYFDGTGDWLLGADNTALQLGTGTFTVEGWVYRNASGTYGLVGKGTSTTGWLVSLNASNQVVFTFDTSTITSVGTVAATTWTHIAVVREGTGANQTKIYISGTNDGTGTVSNNFNQTNPIYVGADRTGGSAANAYLQDLRITKGVARYTSNFTPPTAPFPVR